MRVFVTGATGFVGSAVVPDLINAGHSVVGLARSDSSAAALKKMGAGVHLGELTDLDSLRRGAAVADAVIHTAFIHDFAKFAENCAIDGRAIEAMGSELEGSGRRLIVTSGSALLSPGKVSTEGSMIPNEGKPVPRVSEQTALPFASKGVHVSIVRLPPSVHGTGDHGFVPLLIGLARTKGVSAYVGDGANRWPAVHRLDAGRLYNLVLENGESGACYHAIAEEGVPFREIATVIGRRLGLPVESRAPEMAAEHFGWFTHFATVDAPSSSRKTRDALGWAPTQRELIEDIDRPAYFEATA